jgi:hydrogenase maturation factor HypF (carbamoyltransferase family)
MNRYQEALDRLGAEKLARGELIRNDSKVESYLLILQELVDKEKSMKVTDIHVDEFYCPKCHSEITHDTNNIYHPQYCEECGQRLDWSDRE